jgi:hypothetical protein
MLPFALANPSRSSFAALPASALVGQGEKVTAYFEERGIQLMPLQGVTGSWEKKQVHTDIQTVLTVLPPDTPPDCHWDEQLEHSNNDD